MPEKKWTPQQKNAIEARGGTVLVSAAAGSGKTAVLVERVMGRICDAEDPIDADRLLVVTFSNAAALEMKQRLTAALSDALAENPDDFHLQKQKRLLEQAQISTIHAFCLDLIRNAFHQLGISPNTRTGDEKELEILRRDCMEEAVEALYQEDESGDFRKLIELISTGRDDRKLFETVEAFYDFIRAHPFFREWLDEKLTLYDSNVPVGETVWGKGIFKSAAETLAYCKSRIEDALRVVMSVPEIQMAYGPAFASDLSKLEALLALCAANDWTGIYTALKGMKRERLGTLKEASPEKAYVTAIRDEVYTKILPKLQKGAQGKEGLFCATPEEFADDIQFLKPLLACLFHLTLRFDSIYSEAKKERAILDFADMEQYALELLAQPDGLGGFQPTALAQSAGSAYDEILVDEFQDTNEVQELIFRCISNQGENLFMVGDVKQSIYRFRQACPQLFLRKKQEFAPYDGERFPAKIILAKNFRSAPEVTEGINRFFVRLMSRDFGDIEYNEEEALIPGRVYPEGTWRGCTLRLLEGESSGGKDKAALEAADVARQIRHLLDTNTLVTGEDGELRPIRYSDICILMRSVQKKAKIYQDAMAEYGIPAWAEPKNGYLKRREIAPLISFMRIMGNPLLDIDLAAAMLSPLFDFTADELSQIRQAAPGKPLYQGVQVQAEQGDAHCTAFLQEMEQFRYLAANAPADQVLRRLFDRTDYYQKVQVMPGGYGRRANLLLFIEYARAYHAQGWRGIAGFTGFLDKLLKGDGDLAPASGFSEQANVVRIMTIHRSKGLEFPVVFLCDCAKDFNKADYIGNVLWNSELGFACARRDFDTRKQYTTVPLQALKLEQQAASLAEELRMLYVAMTRAKERLIMTGVCADFHKSLASWKSKGGSAGEKVVPYVMRGAKSYLDWLMLASGPYLDEEGALAGAAGFIFQLVRAGDPGLEKAVIAEAQASESGEACLQIQERIAFAYPWEAQTKIPSKLAVSQIAKGATANAYRFHAMPAFLSEKGMTGAQKGNALHKFMQFSDYQNAAADVEAEISRLEQSRFLSKLEADAIDRGCLRTFFAGPLAKRIFQSQQVMREQRFLAEVGADEIGAFTDLLDQESKTVIQGIADCVFVEDGQAVIVDYKSDRVPHVEALLERYSIQLEIYRRILGNSLGLPIKECILYSFWLSCEAVL